MTDNTKEDMKKDQMYTLASLCFNCFFDPDFIVRHHLPLVSCLEKQIKFSETYPHRDHHRRDRQI